MTANLIKRLVFLFYGLLSATAGYVQNINFDLLQGQSSVKIPFELKHNFIIIDVRLNGILPLHFIFDTGAQYTLLFKKEYSDILRIPYLRRIPILGADLSQELYALVAQNITVDIPGRIKVRKDILIFEEDYFQLDELTGIFIDGILGGDAFKHYVTQIDYRKQILTLTKKEHFQEPGSHYHRIPLRLKEAKPLLNATVTLENNARVPVSLLMDTGSGIPLLLYANTHPNLSIPEKTILGQLGKGLGGYLLGYMGRIKQLDLPSNLEFTNVLASFQRLDSASQIFTQNNERNGILGNQVLRRFDVIIDYPDSVLYLKPTRSYKQKFNYDRSGMLIYAIGHNLKDFYVNTIIPGSPAEEADIREGDLILKIRGLPASLFDLTSINRMLMKRPGKKIKVTIERNGERMEKTFRLRDLI
ncbi:MAG TPA: aspartyl protease family protein [Saprospiraceae bacterium]|nr:aspartyl protease family protein [Saprospiraceae bacterium]HPG08338.1 aspartyl protease family protein [Saprospiraceae bacterium]HRV85593.1 aspartyl protease family protein [Saprospiraceae bacterium]